VAAKKNGRFATKSGDWADIKFSRITLTAEQKRDFKALTTEEKSRFVDKTVQMIVSGHKASIVWEDAHQCFIFSLTCKLETHVNYNVCMSSRSDDLWEAMALTAFKTLYCCPEGEWVFEGDENFG